MTCGWASSARSRTLARIVRTFSSARRRVVDQAIVGHHSRYAREVRFVNRWLDRDQFTISARSAGSVIANVRAVEQGARTEAQAHHSEAVGFARDARESFARGDYRQASIELFGAVLNAAAGLWRGLGAALRPR